MYSHLYQLIPRQLSTYSSSPNVMKSHLVGLNAEGGLLVEGSRPANNFLHASQPETKERQKERIQQTHTRHEQWRISLNNCDRKNNGKVETGFPREREKGGEKEKRLMFWHKSKTEKEKCMQILGNGREGVRQRNWGKKEKEKEKLHWFDEECWQ